MFELTFMQFVGVMILFFFIIPIWAYIMTHIITFGFYRSKNNFMISLIKEELKNGKK